MTRVEAADPQQQQPDAGSLATVGGWLFRHRSALPVPLAVALLIAPVSTTQPWLVPVGAAVVAIGESLRLWAVHHIGVISRTRSDRLGPLVSTGPFSLTRNPLYLGNILLWAGFGLCARVAWLAVVIAVVLALEYHAIVAWEERLLEARRGEEYRTYTSRVPRWLPRLGGPAVIDRPAIPFSWRETLFSERSTLLAIAVGAVLLWLKARLTASS